MLCQDLQEHCGTDKATFDLINILRYSDQVHDRKDEETISLLNQLNLEKENKETKVNKVPNKTNKKNKVNKAPSHKNTKLPSSAPKKEDEQ